MKQTALLYKCNLWTRYVTLVTPSVYASKIITFQIP